MDKCTSLKINVVVVLMNISQKRVIYRLLSVKHFSVCGTYAPTETMKYN